MRTSFELEIDASTMAEATAVAENKIASYLEIGEAAVKQHVDIEYKVKTNSEGVDKVHVYATVKRSISSL